MGSATCPRQLSSLSEVDSASTSALCRSASAAGGDTSFARDEQRGGCLAVPFSGVFRLGGEVFGFGGGMLTDASGVAVGVGVGLKVVVHVRRDLAHRSHGRPRRSSRWQRSLLVRHRSQAERREWRRLEPELVAVASIATVIRYRVSMGGMVSVRGLSLLINSESGTFVSRVLRD